MHSEMQTVSTDVDLQSENMWRSRLPSWWMGSERAPAGDPSPAALGTKAPLLQHPRQDGSSLIGPQLDVKQFVLAEGAANDLIKQSRRKKIAA